jgi:hypothetical protein
LLVFAASFHHRYHFTKKAFFTVITCIILATTTALVVINLQLISSSEDSSITRMEGRMSVFACGQEIDILPSSSVFNQSSGDSRHRIYPDGRLEFLGYRTEPETDGSIGSFFKAIGGSISANAVALPYNDATAESIVNNATLARFVKTNPIGEKYLELRSGESCETTPSMVTVFIYEYSPSTHSFAQQRIIQTPEQYILTDKPFGEPDCVVVIYGQPDTKTNLTCTGYPDISQITTDPLEGLDTK